MSWLAVKLLLIYRRYLSPLKGPTCRFDPTCSQYALLAFRKYGFVKGVILTTGRISRCHPFNPGGYDPLK